MIEIVKKLIFLLTPQQRNKLKKLQILVFLSAFFEVGALAFISPFMAIISNANYIYTNKKLNWLLEATGIKNQQEFIYFFGFAVLFALLISTIVAIFTSWQLSLFSNRIGTELADRLLIHYLHQPWLFHASGNSSHLTKQITAETNRVTNHILNPLMQMVAKGIMCMVLLIVLFVFQPLVAASLILIFSSAYYILYKIVRGRLVKNGRIVSTLLAKRFKVISESLGAVKDIIVLGRQQNLTEQFVSAGKELMFKQATNQTMTVTPKFIMELVIYGTVIIVVLILLNVYRGDFKEILPILSIYGLAGVKLLPAFQQIYVSLSNINGSIGAFESIYHDLSKSQQQNFARENDATIRLKQSISLVNVSLKYPNKQTYALKNINIEIPVNKTIGIVGKSGSGKSTLIDLLLGLISPTDGELYVDSNKIDKVTLRSWQNNLGYVPQQIYLADTSIKCNIALGIAEESIDTNRVYEVTKLAQLDDFIDELPEGINTIVGERGVQLSGGQRQRIGIARALYHNPDVLIFDEATSALDNLTEQMVMQSIAKLDGTKTIILVAHRLTTLSSCQKIIELKNGEILRDVSYQDINNENKTK